MVFFRRRFVWAENPFEMLERVRVTKQKDVALRWLSR